MRSVFAQCYRLGGRSGGTRQTRNFSSPPESNGAGETIGELLLRPVGGMTLGSFLAYRMFGGKASELDERRKQALRESEEFFEESEKSWSDMVSRRRS